MKQKNDAPTRDEMREEYTMEQIHSGVRGKYFANYQAGINIVKLAPDVAAVFNTEEKVNEALRSLIKNPLSTKSAA